MKCVRGVVKQGVADSLLTKKERRELVVTYAALGPKKSNKNKKSDKKSCKGKKA